MSSPARVEARKYVRLPLSLPVFVRGIDENGKEFLEFATALNISAGGTLLAMRRNLPLHSTVSLQIPVVPLPAEAGCARSVHSMKAKLIRAIHGGKYHFLGLRFNRPIQL